MMLLASLDGGSAANARDFRHTPCWQSLLQRARTHPGCFNTQSVVKTDLNPSYHQSRAAVSITAYHEAMAVPCTPVAIIELADASRQLVHALLSHVGRGGKLTVISEESALGKYLTPAARQHYRRLLEEAERWLDIQRLRPDLFARSPSPNWVHTQLELRAFKPLEAEILRTLK